MARRVALLGVLSLVAIACGGDFFGTRGGSLDRCCDPATQPGENGNHICIEGVRCCGDGSWECNQGDGSSTCGPHGGEGQMCRAGVNCCDPADEPGENGNHTCIEGVRCCGDGSWECNQGDGSSNCGSHGGEGQTCP